MAPFSVIVFGVVVWTIAVSGAKHAAPFLIKTDQCGRGLTQDSKVQKYLFTKQKMSLARKLGTSNILKIFRSAQIQTKTRHAQKQTKNQTKMSEILFQQHQDKRLVKLFWKESKPLMKYFPMQVAKVWLIMRKVTENILAIIGFKILIC